MAKAILGQRVYRDDRLVLEAARLRSRVRDLETLIEDLQNDNDRLREDPRSKVGVLQESVH
jgi:cell division protein FtsB